MSGENSRIYKLLSYAFCDGNKGELEAAESEKLFLDFQRNCQEMMERDYACEVLNNQDGQLCSTYPEKLLIPVSPTSGRHPNKLHELVHKCRFARTRSRFAVPVLLFNDKYICRSSTLARSPEIYCRNMYGSIMQGEDVTPSPASNLSLSEYTEMSRSGLQSNSNTVHAASDSNPDLTNGAINENGKNKEWLLDKMRNADINLLHFLEVDTIFDLMVEKKKVKFGMNVTSSEKVDRLQRYLQFNLLGVPYPGCEFFTEYSNSNYSGEGLMFDWKQNFVDADLSIPDNIRHLTPINWQEYVQWDLIKLTQNYLKLILHSLLSENSKGLLLHCISGWDRTPLFVSLVRLSLWADGLAHQSLNPEEMIYFTIVYDWLLFSHQFTDRIAKGEEIFYFCFDFLKYMEEEEYSVLPHLTKQDKIEGFQCLSSTEKTSYATDLPQEEVGLVSQNGIHSKAVNGFNHCKEEMDGCEEKLGQEESGPDIDENQRNNCITTDNVAIVDINETLCWNQKDAINTSKSSSPVEEIDETEKLVQEEASEKNILPSSADANIQVSRESVECVNGNGENSKESTVPFANGNQQGIEIDESDFEKIDERPATVEKESDRKRKLRRARELLIPAYQAALHRFQSDERQQGSTFTAIFNQITKTFNLGKR